MMMSTQMLQFLSASLLVAQGVAIFCSQCHSSPGKFVPACYAGIQTVKRCPSSAQHCVTKTILPNSGAKNSKEITVIRACATTTRNAGCITIGGEVTCTTICERDGCNVGPVQLIPATSSSSSTATSSATTTSATSTSTATTTLTATTTTEAWMTSGSGSTESVSQRCFQCSSRNGQNIDCETNPNSSLIVTCPSNKPYCALRIFTSSVFRNAITVQRNCSSAIINQCTKRGNGLMNTCVTTCTDDACNGRSVTLRTPSRNSTEQSTTTSTATTTTTSTTTEASTPSLHRCYECSSSNGQNPDCVNNLNSTHVIVCPESKPFCRITTTTSSFFSQVKTIQRECSSTMYSQCVSHGNGFINSCFSACEGDLCNDQQEKLR